MIKCHHSMPLHPVIWCNLFFMTLCGVLRLLQSRKKKHDGWDNVAKSLCYSSPGLTYTVLCSSHRQGREEDSDIWKIAHIFLLPQLMQEYLIVQFTGYALRTEVFSSSSSVPSFSKSRDQEADDSKVLSLGPWRIAASQSKLLFSCMGPLTTPISSFSIINRWWNPTYLEKLGWERVKEAMTGEVGKQGYHTARPWLNTFLEARFT